MLPAGLGTPAAGVALGLVTVAVGRGAVGLGAAGRGAVDLGKAGLVMVTVTFRALFTGAAPLGLEPGTVVLGPAMVGVLTLTVEGAADGALLTT